MIRAGVSRLNHGPTSRPSVGKVRWVEAKAAITPKSNTRKSLLMPRAASSRLFRRLIYQGTPTQHSFLIRMSFSLDLQSTSKPDKSLVLWQVSRTSVQRSDLAHLPSKKNRL